VGRGGLGDPDPDPDPDSDPDIAGDRNRPGRGKFACGIGKLRFP